VGEYNGNSGRSDENSGTPRSICSAPKHKQTSQMKRFAEVSGRHDQTQILFWRQQYNFFSKIIEKKSFIWNYSVQLYCRTTALLMSFIAL
jgi:hypothetical protein